MKKSVHTIYIAGMVVITVLTTIYLAYTGYTYYNTSLEERFYHPHHDWFKPSGVYGQGLGILGTFMILFGVVIYIARKRYNFMSRVFKRLKYLLEFHIFLCTLGPILILFHTAFKFGGIVSIAFWSMVAVVLSGVVGRFIYIQIPHTIDGKAMSMSEIQEMKLDLSNVLREKFNFKENLIQIVEDFTNNKNGNIKSIQKLLQEHHVPKKERAAISKIIKQEKKLAKKISRLETMKNLFKYWHVAHLPFALVMLIIVMIHVGVSLAFGYKWIF